MKFYALLVAFVSPCIGIGPAVATPLDDGGPKRVFIKYKAGKHDECLRSIHKDTRLSDSSSPTRMLFDFPSLDALVLNVESPNELLALRNDPAIEEMYHDVPRTTQMIQGSVKRYPFPRRNHDGDGKFPPKNLRNSAHNLPPQQKQQQQQIPYGVDMIKAPFAWQHGIKGAGVKVCVIDTGTMIHEDLDQTTLDGSVAESFWFQGSNNDDDSEWFVDSIGHGTHVAGTIAALDNNIGVVGVAPEADLFIVKYFADESGYTYSSSLIDAAYKCRDAGVQIISMSLGGPIPSPFEFRVFEKLLEENGILSFAAAGNNGGNRPAYPASYNGVTSVAAVDRNQEHAYFSQQNRRVDIAAPGVDILSLLPLRDSGGRTTSGYGIASGTSMATPHVAGAAALLWSFQPEATAQDIIAAMELSAIDLGGTGRDDLYGHGLVNVMEALTLLNGGPLLSMEQPPAIAIQSITPSSSQQQPGDQQEFVVDIVTSNNSSSQAEEAETPVALCSSDVNDATFVAFDLTLATDQYASETSWELFRTLDASLRPVLSSGSGEEGFENSHVYEWHECLPADCYTFVIYDTAEDGLCCDYGSGSYSVSFGGVEIASRDGVFGSRQAVSMGFCADPTNLETVTLTGAAAAAAEEEEDDAESNGPSEEVEDGENSNATVTASPIEVEDALTGPFDQDEDCVEITLTLTTDTYPGETSFQLVKLVPQEGGSSMSVMSSSSMSAAPDSPSAMIWDHSEFSESEDHRFVTCQDPMGCYEFRLLDSFGDGLCCEYGRGTVELSFDGEVVLSESSFGDEIHLQFGGEACPMTERIGS